eukprot:TRINITY_DN16751_c0_g1_i2.p1 TRINITY_DN16751_c0_g1~~TRINITY_DN16751_c0_g1_i2.p1  ORF type:complete len:323 (+),score=85.47 TRINITY_DN16751_c0_g1_i2:174-1142(+)
MNLDEQAVGQHNTFEVPEHLSEANETTSMLPLQARIKAKNPKVRFEASCELARDAKRLNELEETTLIKLLADSHPGVQEKALDILSALLQSDCKLVNEEMVTVIVEKCVASAKHKSKGVETLLSIAELPNAQQMIYDILKNFLCTKGTSAKVMCAVLHALTQLLANYGNPIFPAKEVLKPVSAQAGSTNLGVKNEAMEYLKEACRWVKEKLLPFVEGLKGVQQEELKKCFDDVKPEPKRFVKGLKMETKVAEEAGRVNVPKSEYLEAEEVAVLGRFSEKWCNAYLELKKWTEKRDKLQELLTALNIERAKPCLLYTSDAADE